MPLVPFTGVTVNGAALQADEVIFVIAGHGLTVTVTVKGVPVQLPDVGVTVYVAVCAVFVGFKRVPDMFAWLVPVAPPVMPPVTTGNPQVYKVPAGTMPLVPLTGVTVKGVPLHPDAVIFVIAGPGFTVTVTVNVAPVQPPDKGVTV
jgi:hypothetical protein